ncbi:inactive hydroxysteroid dehydrogenase-like protein 1 [Dysidea avara]|uniref:inactive hydroxysteroid dehydrogenase-like protein 1 n=1 Tax=Dysidea avara TaxID=196820 RepID=UPI003318A80F
MLTEDYPTIRNIVFLVGVLYLLRLMVWSLLSLWSGTKAFFLTGLFKVDLKSYGWAVVTGASDGIGRGYALELARCGVNVVLVSRSEEKLRNVEKEILDQYDVMVRIVVVDFSSRGEDIYDGIRTELSGLEIGILINNVGVTYEYPNYFDQVTEDRLWQLINVNMASAVMMSKMILPDMVDKKRGIIVNMSSMCALNPLPLLTVYSGTKIFMDYFSSALRYEYSDKGIIVQNILPCYVATRMSGIRRPSFFTPSPTDYAHDAIATIGIQEITYGTLAHAIQTFLMVRFPEWFFQLVTFRILDNTRKRSIRKRQKT